MAQDATKTADKGKTGTASGNNGGGRKKTTCPVTAEQFLKAAKAKTVKIDDIPLPALAKEFSTGSFGWNANAKMTVEVDGQLLEVQVGVNLTVVGSKEAARK